MSDENLAVSRSENTSIDIEINPKTCSYILIVPVHIFFMNYISKHNQIYKFETLMNIYKFLPQLRAINDQKCSTKSTLCTFKFNYIYTIFSSLCEL